MKPESDILVKTEGLYAGIYDIASLANVPLFTKGTPHARDLNDFNQLLLDRAAQGQLLSWTLLFDGVFRAVIKVAKPTTSGYQDCDPINSLGSNLLVANLVFPSGRLILSCLSRLGKGEAAILTVEPGEYRVTVIRDGVQEEMHAFLEDPALYPAGEGPDWRITIMKAKATVQEIVGKC